MNLPEALKRLNKVATAINQSYTQLYGAYGDKTKANETGFQGMPPQLLQACLVNVLMAKRPIKSVIDLGCGNGTFALMAAALGWRAYGIDASEDLVREACQLRDALREQGVISTEVVCEFAQGSIYPQAWQADYAAFVAAKATNAFTMPVVDADAYMKLGIVLDDVDMIYAFTWSDQMPFLCRFLAASASPSATFLLPHYRGVEGRFDETLKLTPLPERVPSALFVGTRA